MSWWSRSHPDSLGMDICHVNHSPDGLGINSPVKPPTQIWVGFFQSYPHGCASVVCDLVMHCPRDSAHGPRITKSGARELNNVLAENQKILMTIIEKCRHRGLPNAEPEGWKNADPEDCQKLSPRIAKSRYQELNNVIAVNQKILIMIVEKCRCWELKNADTDDYQKWSPRVDNMRTLNITKSGARELRNAEPEN